MMRPDWGAGPLAAFAALGLVWGYNWVVIKVALRYAGPMDFAAWRVGCGVLVLFGLLIALRAPLRPRHIGKTLLIGVLQTAAFIGFVSWALAYGETGKSAVLAYTMPFWVIVLGWPFLGERLHGWQWPAVALALVGLALVIEPWNADTGLAASLLALAAGAAWGVSVIVVKRVPIGGRMELLSLTAWQMLYGFLPLLAAAFFVPERAIDWSGTFAGALLYNAVGAMTVASLLWLYVLQRLPALISGLSSLIVPIVGIGAAWLQLGEQPSRVEGIGMVLILAALAILLLSGARAIAFRGV